MPFEEIRSQYMSVRNEGGGGSFGGLSPSAGSGLPVYTGCSVSHLIQDRAVLPTSPYFARVAAKIAELSGENRFIYVAGWWLGETFSLSGASGTLFVDLLKQKAREGIDVRVMGWVMPPEVIRNSQVQSQAGVILNVNGHTMRSINALRTEPNLRHKAVLNILAHPAGAVHIKMILIGSNSNATGYTGGLDFENFRHDPVWHDVQAEVAGPAVQPMFDLFREMWNEVRSRPVAAGLTANGTTCDSHSSSMPDLSARTLTATSSGRMHVQSARTCPQFNFSTGVGIVGIPTNTPLSYAPGGIFEIKQMWQKGISGARSYIYMEDQSFTSYEVFDWINAALRTHSELRVILLAGGDDPTAPSPGEMGKANIAAVNDHLLAGLSASDITNRVAYCKHTGPGKYVHSKTTLIDDKWAMIGSANCMRRSLYTDIEHSVAFMDEAGVAVASYRSNFWETILRTTYPTMSDAANAFFALPFQGSGTPATALAMRLRLPFTANPLTADEQVLLDQVFDVDSRSPWGGGLVSLYLRGIGGSLVP